MTEAEWLTCTDTCAMLQFLGGKGSERKFRLFACACCRRIGHLLTDERSRKGVEVAEQFADAKASEDELNMARRAAWAVSSHRIDRLAVASEAAAEALWLNDAYGSAYHAHFASYNSYYSVGEAASASECAVQRRILGDIFGNPFRSFPALAVSWLAWNDGAIRKIAQAIYDARAFDCLPLLADALEDAGCTDADILAHCREPGEHVRGCWVVDLLLGKE